MDLNKIKNNYINENIKYIVLIIEISQDRKGEKEDSVNFLLSTVSTVPFLNKSDAVNYINNLDEMDLQGILIQTDNTAEEDLLAELG